MKLQSKRIFETKKAEQYHQYRPAKLKLITDY